MVIPPGVCIVNGAYDDFVEHTGLRKRILLELNRKPFEDMRWEEIWDTALRIRNIFLNTPMPDDLLEVLKTGLIPHFADKSAVVRSSSLAEDSGAASFAGLHESYVNVSGMDAILAHIKLVWASLWSDSAILYRQELGLDIETASMAVVVQEIVVGDKSGVVFSQSPDDGNQMIIESVYGLNQGLVDGTVEPDRWLVGRKTGKILSHTPVIREKAIMPSPTGIKLTELTEIQRENPPLNHTEIKSIFDLALSAENYFGTPQDVEWTFRDQDLFVLQARPITTLSPDPSEEKLWTKEDKRSWYMTLKRSFENLKTLREKIEFDLIPQMDDDAAVLSKVDLTGVTDDGLIGELRKREKIHKKWLDVYWQDFIPFAHGARLFGQVYNEMVQPDDPYEFTKLLGATKMISLERNRMIDQLTEMIRQDEQLKNQLANGEYPTKNEQFNQFFEEFIKKFSDLTYGSEKIFSEKETFLRLLLSAASKPSKQEKMSPSDLEKMKAQFLNKFPEDQQEYGLELLEIGRSSYRLRDNDNIHLAKIEAQFIAALDEAKRRIAQNVTSDMENADVEEIIKALKTPGYIPKVEREQVEISEPVENQARPNLQPEKVRSKQGQFRMKARQIVGQPAGPGLAVGNARVIKDKSDLFEFKSGEIIVCDAIDPNMTFIVPLSAGIIERRGGMLIHGAIIAREYGLPCVTGIPKATSLIQTGDNVTVDGYLGIVTVGKE